MKKIATVIVAVASLLLVATVPADARGRGGSHGHHGFHHHGRVVVGAGVFLGPVWWPDYYWYPPYYYPYYYPPVYDPGYTTPAVAQPPTYIQQAPVPTYWYYCESPPGYYPYVQQCPGGWLTVVPPAPAPPR